ELLKQIGDDPETGGAYIKGMSDLNLSSFHDLTHGGMEHITRRWSGSAVEPSYSVDELRKLLKVRNQYVMLIACFLLQLANDESGLNAILCKRDEWKNAL